MVYLFDVSAPITQHGVAITKGGSLNAKYVLHLDVRDMNSKHDWKKGISRCLQEATNAELTSLSFPALGTGTVDHSMFCSIN